MASSSLIGLSLNTIDDLKTQFADATSMGFTFICVDLFEKKSVLPVINDDILPLIRSDSVYSRNGESISGSIVGRISSWIDCDAEDQALKSISEKFILKELNWATHLALPAVKISLTKANNPNLARILTSFLSAEYFPIKIWITLPMMLSDDILAGDATEALESSFSPWHWWSQLVRLSTGVSESLGLLLDLPEDLPNENIMKRWLSEPCVCLNIRSNLFLTNAKGYPVLSSAHQIVLRQFFKINTQILLSGECNHERGFGVYQQYILWQWKNAMEAQTIYEKHSKGLEDQLQDPLQPLQDNLSSATYGVFEMDPYKYKAYEEAIYSALLQRSGKRIPGSVVSEDKEFPSLATSVGDTAKGSLTEGIVETNGEVDAQVVFILGAGRGPFVDATLQASARAGCPVRIYVVEKNPNALLTLRHRLITDWKSNNVTLLPGDMRSIEDTSEKADIFVSELLGSFGDNELSPECLDGAEHLLKDGGLSIPSQYTSYVAPIQSLRIHLEASRSRESYTLHTRIQKPLETPYVVRLQNFKLLDEPQKAFTFVHPRKDLLRDNSRFCTLKFTSTIDGIVHGFAGYFDAVLFEKIDISIHPKHHSQAMFSWFPMVFPMETPTYVKAGECITFHLWRCISSRYVWYEWAMTEPITSKIHNAGGSAYRIGL